MKRALAFALVVVQILLLAWLLVLPHGILWPVNGFVIATSVALVAIGVTLAVQGSTSLGPAMTASPIPRDNAPLATTGVYGVVRNPIYTGLMTAGLGLTVIGSSALHVVVWLALIGLFSGKARWEERMLVIEHPDYSEYAARVGRFLPGVGRIR
ncbi:isoprenylcysteine carboxylmethyltransferase family protein [Cryobacterium sp. PAMC25264]|uniref:methyltransferase family protein n=1 Tax=Cryobacterium sp. PAMC25264 TaxID=2861288 RepID=UPI001C629D90|nr:isoprenylcysteine carboxylmethyltransferase family protein [Cryobacterium sp. PAMC25264]QYF74516.1 isoprenylcysteine carboxylmethyltransferase family protein [Cryobacterium sp. PAMC25264]